MILGNVITNNPCSGIDLGEMGANDPTRPVVRFNTLMGNAGACFKSELSVALSAANGPVDASRNFWGTTVIEDIKRRAGIFPNPLPGSTLAPIELCPILDGEGDLVSCSSTALPRLD